MVSSFTLVEVEGLAINSCFSKYRETVNFSGEWEFYGDTRLIVFLRLLSLLKHFQDCQKRIRNFF